MNEIIIGTIAASAATLLIIILMTTAICRIRFLEKHNISTLRDFYRRRNDGK